MARPHLPSGDFFGAAARTIESGGFRVGLWIASRPPEAVEGHVHDDAHFILALDGFTPRATTPAHAIRHARQRIAAVWPLQRRARLGRLGARCARCGVPSRKLGLRGALHP